MYDKTRTKLGQILLDAASNGDLNKVTELVEKDQGLLAFQDKEGRTALINAAWRNQTEVLKFLVTKKPDLEIINHSGLNAVHAAASYGYHESLEILLANGASVEALSRSDKTALLRVVDEDVGSENVEKYLLSAQILVHHKANVNFQNKSGDSILHNTKHDTIFEYLLTQKPELELKNPNNYERTVLLSFCAKPRNHWLKIEKLIKHKANINAVDSQGYSALDLLLKASNEHNRTQSKKAIKLLLDATDPSFDKALITKAVHKVLSSPSDEAAKQLALIKDLDISIPSLSLGKYLSVLYKQQNYSDLLNQLDKISLGHEEKIEDVLDEEGNTLLMRALKDKKFDVAKRLIPISNLNIRNKKDESALDLACAHKKIDLISALLEAGANPNEVDKNGRPLLLRNFLNTQIALALHAYPKSVPDVLGDAFTQAPSALKNNESGSCLRLNRYVYSDKYCPKYFASTP